MTPGEGAVASRIEIHSRREVGVDGPSVYVYVYIYITPVPVVGIGQAYKMTSATADLACDCFFYPIVKFV